MKYQTKADSLLKSMFQRLAPIAAMVCCVLFSCQAQTTVKFIVEYKSYQSNYTLGFNNSPVNKATTKFIGFDSLQEASSWIINNLSKREEWGETDKRQTWSTGSFNKPSELVCIYDLRSVKTIPFKMVSDTTIQESRIQIDKQFNVNTYFKVSGK